MDEGVSHPKLTEALSSAGRLMWVTDSQSVKGTTVTHKLMTGAGEEGREYRRMARIMDIDPEVLKKTISITALSGAATLISEDDLHAGNQGAPYYFGVEYQDPHYERRDPDQHKAEALNTAGLPIPGSSSRPE